MSDNPHVAYANAKLRQKRGKSQGSRWDVNSAEREMISISGLHKIKTGKHINAHGKALVAHHKKANEIKREYVHHSSDLIHAKNAGDKDRMERAAKGKAKAEKAHLAHTGRPAEEKYVEYKEGKEMKTFKELYEACCAACENRADIEEVKEPTGGLKDACWKGYTAVGMKEKNGRKVPNCVPANEGASPNAGKNVVPPPAGNIGAGGGLVREEENENKPLGKVMRAGDGKKKFKVFVKNDKGNTVKVGFGDPNMEIKRDDPERRKNFRARHNCDTAKDRTTPKYWSCRQWRASAKVEA